MQAEELANQQPREIDETELVRSRNARVDMTEYLASVNPYYLLAIGVSALVLIIGTVVGCYIYRKKYRNYDEFVDDELFGDIAMKGNYINDAN